MGKRIQNKSYELISLEQQEYLLNNYSGKTLIDLESETGINKRLIGFLFNDKGINIKIKPISPEQHNFIIENCNNMTVNALAEKLGIDGKRLKGYVLREGIEVKGNKVTLTDEQKDFYLNNFDVISILEMAEKTNVNRRYIGNFLRESGCNTERIMTNEQKEYILNNYPNKTIKDISSILNIDNRRISSFIKENNIEVSYNPIFNKEDVKDIIQSYKILTLDEIRKKYKSSRNRISKIIKENNINVINKSIVTLDIETLTVFDNILRNQWLNTNQLANLINISIPTINKKLSEHEKYGILPKEALIEKLISYSDTFKLIHNDYVQNKEDINCGKDYVEELKLTNNINLNVSTIKSCIEIIDDNFDYYHDKELIQKINNMYYDKNLSTIKIGKEFSRCPKWVGKLIVKNGGICNNTYSYNISEPEMEIRNFLSNYINDLEYSNKKILNGQEIDILSEKYKIGIEYNGLYYHSIEFGKDKNYHLNKTVLANEKGYKLIHIFEDEYLKNKDLVLNKLLHLFNIENKENIHARKCVIKEIKTNNESNEFLNKNHIQGSTKSTIKYGAYYNDILISVMVFDNNTMFYKNSDDKNKYELSRFCVDNKYNINGIANRLLKQFIKDYKPVEIISFADRRWTLNKDNNLYIKLNFKLDNIGTPNYFWCKKQNRYKSYNFIKTKISKKEEFKDIYSPEKTEIQMMNEAGYVRVYDCGLFRYKLSL